jgi:predicted lysophospholipase L1 biosynthesis ABC-type transport system permease subunit
MRGRNYQAVLLAVVLMLAASAFAANKGAFQLNNTVSVNGKQLQAGDYSVTWDGDGPDVQLNIMKGRKVVAQTAAKVVPVDQASGSNQAVVLRNSDGSASLKELRFNGKKFALAIGAGGSAAAGAGSGGSSN